MKILELFVLVFVFIVVNKALGASSEAALVGAVVGAGAYIMLSLGG